MKENMPNYDLPGTPRGQSLLRPKPGQLTAMPPGAPILIIGVDTEAEFDWGGPFSRSHTSVRNVRNQVLAQAIFDRFCARPVYLVDYAVATQETAFAVLRDIAATGRCEIGAHLHP